MGMAGGNMGCIESEYRRTVEGIPEDEGNGGCPVGPQYTSPMISYSYTWHSLPATNVLTVAAPPIANYGTSNILLLETRRPTQSR